MQMKEKKKCYNFFLLFIITNNIYIYMSYRKIGNSQWKLKYYNNNYLY